MDGRVPAQVLGMQLIYDTSLFISTMKCIFKQLNADGDGFVFHGRLSTTSFKLKWKAKFTVQTE